MTKRRVLTGALLIILAAVVAAMLWQQSRYSDIRREFAQDRQSPLHGQSLHVLTYLTAPPGVELLPSLRALQASAEREGSGLLIYAGKVVQNARESSQLTEALGRVVAWDAIILQQFESLEAYSRYLEDEDVQAALSVFPVRFAHGMRRSATLNLLLPQTLLLRRLQRLITFAPAILPFEPGFGAEGTEIPDAARSMLPEVDSLSEKAIVVVNLMLEGDIAQSAANADYSNQMLSLFAEQEHGPIHLGTSVAIDHPLDFTSVALVYYPGASYFRDLLLSTFFQEIVGDKQLADTNISVTVPITNQL